MAPLHIGDRHRRTEDARLVVGGGCFAGDVRLPGQAYMAVRRSHLAHAVVEHLDVSAAKAMPGVLGVFTAGDLPLTARFLFDNLLPPALATMGRPVLANDEVHHIGEPVAVVVADSPYLAQDAVDAIHVQLRPLPACGTLGTAMAPGAPLVHGSLGTNLVGLGVDGFGDVEAGFGPGAVVVSARLEMGRVSGSAIEPRASTAAVRNGQIALWASTQAVYRVRDMVAKALDVKLDDVVVRAQDVGGGFGPKGRRYPEDLLIVWAARHLGRPIQWIASRSEDAVSSTHAHGSIFELELAAEPDGRLRALRGVLWHEIGAYPSIGVLLAGSIIRNMLCTYRLPALAIEAVGVFTNTTPTGTVRGGPGPEGNFAIERMMDVLAGRLGIDPAEVRRRNLIPNDLHPYTVRLANSQFTVDSGDFPNLLREAVRLIGPPGNEDDGKLHGIGIAMGVELAADLFRSEAARVQMHKDGTVNVFVGSSPQGQGHETMATQIVADRLGWPLERIKVTAGDTRWLARGGPTATSRSAVSVGNAVSLAARSVRQALLEAAASALGTAAVDLEVTGGYIRARVDGEPIRPAIDFIPHGGIDVIEEWRATSDAPSPSSCHAVEVAVDAGTGAVELKRYVVAYDAGILINPLIVEGQLCGGIAHGVGYGLLEQAVYSADGILRTSTFGDYMLASPAEVAFDPQLMSCPTSTASNPEGFKGAGELGTIGAAAAIASAVESALRQLSPRVRITEVPIRSETIVRLLSSMGQG